MAKQFLDKTGLEALVSEIKKISLVGKYQMASNYSGYYKIATLKTNTDTSNGGAFILQGTLGSYGNPNFVNIAITTRDTVRIKGYKLMTGDAKVDIALTRESNNQYSLYIRFIPDWQSCNLIAYATGDIYTNVESSLPSSVVEAHNATLVWNLNNDTSLVDLNALAKTSDLNSYVKLSGGTINGSLEVNNTLTLANKTDNPRTLIKLADDIDLMDYQDCRMGIKCNTSNDLGIRFKGSAGRDLTYMFPSSGGTLATEQWVNGKGYQTASQVNTLIDNKIQDEMLVDQGYVLEHCNAVEDKIPTFSYSNGVLTITTS